MEPHYRKITIPENSGIPSFPAFFFKKAFVFKTKLFFFTIVHIKHNVVFPPLFCFFCIFAQRSSLKMHVFFIDVNEQRNGVFNVFVFLAFSHQDSQ